MMLRKMLLRQKPIFLTTTASTSWLFSTQHLRIDRNTSPAAQYLSTEALESSSDIVGSGQDLGPKAEVTKTLLKRYGFTDTQISKLYTKRPGLFNPEKTLLPKLDFYRGTVGFSNSDLPRFICSNPSLLTSSLHNQIVPVYNFIKGLLSSDYDDETVLNTLKRDGARLLGYSLEKRITPGISALTQAGVPHKHILHLLRQGPTSFGSLSLGDSIKRATEMGFHPNKVSFIQAIRIFAGFSKSTWDKKMEVFRKCGLSDEEILKAFRTNPKIMSLSEGNIKQKMNYFVKKMGWQPVRVAATPTVLNLSLDKRTIPRCTVVRYLQGKGLLRKCISLRTFLFCKDKDFIDKFVKKYEDDVPDLMDIYLCKIKFSPQEPIP